MASFETIGTLHEVFDEVQVTEKFRKREFILEMEDGTYTNYIKFQFVQDKCSALNSYKAGDKVKVLFNLSGRKGTTRDGGVAYYTNLSAWKIEPTDAVSSGGGSSRGGNSSVSSSTSSASSIDAPAPDDDDIPF